MKILTSTCKKKGWEKKIYPLNRACFWHARPKLNKSQKAGLKRAENGMWSENGGECHNSTRAWHVHIHGVPIIRKAESMHKPINLFDNIILMYKSGQVLYFIDLICNLNFYEARDYVYINRDSIKMNLFNGLCFYIKYAKKNIQ